jgi:SAM-dependent methyltransferase
MSVEHDGDQGSPGLTSAPYWDDYWEGTKLPAIARKGANRSMTAILEVLERHLDPETVPTILEVGGAPGQYLGYLAKRFPCHATVLDNSPLGCDFARRNLELLGVGGRVIEGDLFGHATADGTFDFVYSLGLIEHFPDLTRTVRAHLDWVKPGGLLILGCPNFRGVYQRPLSWLRPQMMAHNDQSIMLTSRWDTFERALPVQRLFRGFVGGFDPNSLSVSEEQGALRRTVARIFWIMFGVTRLLRRAPKKINSRLWSGYLIGVYRKTPA